MSSSPRTARNAVWLLAVVAAPLPLALRFDGSHTILAVALTLLLVVLALRSRPAGIAATLLYLVVLGDYRRYASYVSGYPPNDPLLLVAPMAAFVMACVALLDARPRGSSTLAMLLGLLALFMGAEVFNPAQGGILVGLAGALFYLVPMLWFWLGRVYGTPELVEFVLRRLVVPLATLVALLGIWQSAVGLLPFEAAWVDAVRYEALYIADDVVRAFGCFNSSAEYTRFLLLAATTVLAFGLAARSRLVLLLPLLLAAMLLASARGPVVMLFGTAAVLWAVAARNPAAWVPRLLLAGGGVAALLIGLLIVLQQADLGGRFDALLAHQVEGLLNPTDASKSTAAGHVALGAAGVLEGAASVAGKGLGATTLAASKFGEGVFNSEMDVGNMFYSLGILGGLLYLAIVAQVLRQAVGLWRRRRRPADLALLGALVATLLAWLLGGEYSIAAIVWFLVGALDRAHLEPEGERATLPRPARPPFGAADHGL